MSADIKLAMITFESRRAPIIIPLNVYSDIFLSSVCANYPCSSFVEIYYTFIPITLTFATPVRFSIANSYIHAFPKAMPQQSHAPYHSIIPRELRFWMLFEKNRRNINDSTIRRFCFYAAF